MIYTLWSRHKNKCRPLGEKSTGHKTKYTLKTFSLVQPQMTVVPLHPVKVNKIVFCHRGFYDSEEGIVMPLIPACYVVITDIKSLFKFYKKCNTTKADFDRYSIYTWFICHHLWLNIFRTWSDCLVLLDLQQFRVVKRWNFKHYLQMKYSCTHLHIQSRHILLSIICNL